MYIFPITVAAGTPVNAAVTFKETFCKAIPASVTPSVSIVPTVGAITTVGTVSVAPITALITVTYPVCKGGCSKTYQFTEQFEVGVTGAAATVSAEFSNVTAALTDVKCCKAGGITINAVLTVTTTAQA